MVSEKPWNPLAVLVLGAAMVVVLAMNMLAVFLTQQKDAEPGFMQFVLGTVVVQIIAVVLLHFFLKYHGMSWKDFLGARGRRALTAVLFAIGVALIATPLAWGANHLSAKAIQRFQEKPEQQIVIKVLESARDPAQRAVFALAAIVLAPIVEESFFRGILYPLLKFNGYPRMALWGTSLLFAAIHGNLMTFIPLFFLALVLVLLYELTDALLAPIVAHALFNTVNFVFFLYQEPIERWIGSP
jgi:membrane protease YdiL (CAAX protease family)